MKKIIQWFKYLGFSHQDRIRFFVAHNRGLIKTLREDLDRLQGKRKKKQTKRAVKNVSRSKKRRK